MLLTMHHREVPHDSVKRPLYPLLFHAKVSNYIGTMLLIKAKARPFCFGKLAPFCIKILRKRDCLREHREGTHTGKILTIVSSIVDSVSPPLTNYNSPLGSDKKVQRFSEKRIGTDFMLSPYFN